jgi:hypothetical protein
MNGRMIQRMLGCIACTALAVSGASAQGQPPGTVTTSAAITGIHQLDSNLDPGGQVGWSDVAISGGVTRQMVPAFAAGVTARYVSEDWRIDAPAAFGPQPPWRDLQRAGTGFNLSLALSHTFVIGVSPGLEWAFERGASTADALTYGAVANAVKVVGPNLTLGAGASVYRQFYSVKVSPFAIVNWKLNDRFRIANALPAGPEGGAGIEARVTLSPDWEAAGGGVLRSDRYRLADEAPYAGLIGETSSIPLFARLSRKFGPRLKTDLYAGVLANSRLRIRDDNGHEVAHTDYPVSPTFALTLSFKH